MMIEAPLALKIVITVQILVEDVVESCAVLE